ncbi:MAG: hypothetical protein A3B74_02835 [Candidatus Kerfeldbacteria bacterium RIFCSPHIGHO2_02_FULL_42_14]|uniref:Glycerophosphoryl diester phosphodiesterase membrane domain-containing protein n=1 Tax=Candidatus Kerfeldbacteria bacterium RIFCSPHIGHO2_02_FULL_42_14 TaxID=1798540 RepID=A0A1G2AS01_9BACT|nr:MAG: hypothetical protein A3B74_02835 [Candidatus Kerfeldbacteria bacterium RIFCSPHIGHO2_02_FULL_42_14]OGY83904.1 MAG: hypothetical protein A3I91_04975 [Candidatus Kerfeldbacteria bacterium RIFCSPLOWO2_02_FULL_42_19]OGY86557.1 MAG: hypothetical protein A3G01_04855 [Candidatus Kerfeldbacteria bacterium RIFCSPLOWO2_12_FULL_43_9]
MQNTNKQKLPTIADILHDSWNYLMRFYKKFCLILVANIFVSSILILLFVGLVQSSSRTDATSSFFLNFGAFFGVALFIAFFILLIQMLMNIMFIEFLGHTGQGELTLSQAFYKALTKLWSLILLSLLALFITILASLAGNLITALLGTGIAVIQLNWIDVGFSVVDFIVGTITLFFIGIWLMFAPYVLILEQTSVIDAIRESYTLIQGRFGAVILRVILPYIVFFGIGATIAFVPYIGPLIDIFLGPLIAVIYIFVLYKSLKNTK